MIMAWPCVSSFPLSSGAYSYDTINNFTSCCQCVGLHTMPQDKLRSMRDGSGMSGCTFSPQVWCCRVLPFDCVQHERASTSVTHKHVQNKKGKNYDAHSLTHLCTCLLLQRMNISVIMFATWRSTRRMNFKQSIIDKHLLQREMRWKSTSSGNAEPWARLKWRQIPRGRGGRRHLWPRLLVQNPAESKNLNLLRVEPDNIYEGWYKIKIKTLSTFLFWWILPWTLSEGQIKK